MLHKPNTPQDAPRSVFREQAVAFQGQRLDGTVLLAQPVSTTVLSFLAVGVVLVALVFLSVTRYARMETVPGWVVPEGGLIRVTARQGGSIETIFVREGDTIKKGGQILALNLSSALETGDSGAALARQLASQIEATQAATDAQIQKLEAEAVQVSSQRAALVRGAEELEQQLKAMVDQNTILVRRAGRVSALSNRGATNKQDVETAELATLDSQKEAAQARTSILDHQRQIADLDARLVTIPIDIRAAQAQNAVNQATLEQKRTEVAVQNSYGVSASLSGRVVALPVLAGQDVSPGKVVAVLIPEGGSLGVELYVPSRAAGFIREGQEVRLKYQAFPYQKFGTARGVVGAVSPTLLSPGDVQMPEAQLQEPVFRVKVRLEKDTVDAYGRNVSIQPGMLLNADIVFDRRTLLEWLLDPIYAVSRSG